MPNVFIIDSATLWEKENVDVKADIPGIYNFQVCSGGGGGWPKPYEVGIYIDADNRRCSIIEWPKPCKPIRIKSDYGEFVVHLDTATKEEILSAHEVTASFFRDD